MDKKKIVVVRRLGEYVLKKSYKYQCEQQIDVNEFCFLFVLDVIHDFFKTGVCTTIHQTMIKNIIGCFSTIMDGYTNLDVAGITSRIFTLVKNTNECKQERNCELCHFERNEFKKLANLERGPGRLWYYNDTSVLLTDRLPACTALQLWEKYNEDRHDEVERFRLANQELSAGYLNNVTTQMSKQGKYVGRTVDSAEMVLTNLGNVKFSYNGLGARKDYGLFKMIDANGVYYLGTERVPRETGNKIISKYFKQDWFSTTHNSYKEGSLEINKSSLTRIVFSKFANDWGHILLAKAMQDALSKDTGETICVVLRSKDQMLRVIAEKIFQMPTSD